MPQALEFHREWDSKKRKSSVLNDLANSSNEEWDSSSCTAPPLKQRKPHFDWQADGDEEVCNDDLQFMGRAIFDAVTCIGLEKMNEEGSQDPKDVVVEIQGSKLETTKIEEKQETSYRDDQKIHPEPLTLDGTRNCMLSIITEVKETRAKMLMWMREEMQKIMGEGSGGPGVQINFGGQGGDARESQEQQHGSGHNVNNSTGITVLGKGSSEIDFGGEASASGGSGFARQNSLVDGVEYNVRNGNTDLNFGTQNCGRGLEEIGFGKETNNCDRMGSGFGAQKSTGEADVGIGGRSDSDGRMNVDNESRSSAGGVAMSLQNGSLGVVHIESQNARDAVGFRASNELPVEMTYGAQQTSHGIRLSYTRQTNGGSGLVFGRQNVDNGRQNRVMGRGELEIRSSMGAETSNNSVNSACNRQVSAMHVSGEEGIPDLIGTPNHSLQRSVALGMTWNGVVQNSRDVNQESSASGVRGIHFDTHNKLGNGRSGTYRGLAYSSTAYDNSTGMMNSPALQGRTTFGMQMPMSLQNVANTTLNPSGIQPLLGIHSQAVMQNFAGAQNILGLSMNGNMGTTVLGEGMNTRFFPGLYSNDRPRHALSAKSNTLPGSSSMRGRPHKKGGTVHGMDILELNT